MQKLLIACLIFLFGCLPTAHGSEGITIRNASPQEVSAILLKQINETDALIREQNDAFLIVHSQPDNEQFAELWGKGAYLRHLYRFYPTDDGIRVTYEMQAINGAQSASFAYARLGDYRKDKLVFARTRLFMTYKQLILLRKELDSAYLYGMMLALKDGDTVKVADVIPDTPSAEAGLKAGDQVLRFAGIDVKYATNFEMLCRYLQHEIDARPLTLTIVRDNKQQTLSITPRRCTPEEYAVWEKKIFTDEEE